MRQQELHLVRGIFVVRGNHKQRLAVFSAEIDGRALIEQGLRRLDTALGDSSRERAVAGACQERATISDLRPAVEQNLGAVDIPGLGGAISGCLTASVAQI